MPIVSDESLHLAVRHIGLHGDTDIFPFPLEKHWFADEEDAIVALLKGIDLDFDGALGSYPLLAVKTLAGVGYNGFRAATQIDPIWDAYLLGLVLEIAADLERARIETSSNSVFAYRYAPDSTTATLFDKNYGWRAYQQEALALAESHEFVLAADISDFYPRVYHHRLNQVINNATANKEAARRIDILLFKLSGEASYGLPIGGDASRLLAEALLNRVDRLLRTRRVPFVRFVDDYLMFAKTRDEAQRNLVLLSEMLLRNEGLTLSRSKTRLMSSAEFKRASLLSEPDVAESEEETRKRQFLAIRWQYDPYSPTAVEDYESLVGEIEKFDVLALLATEFGKTRVDETLVRQIVKTIRYLSPPVRERAVLSIIDNLGALYPVFPTVAIALRSLLPELSSAVSEKLFAVLRSLFQAGSHIILVPVNMLFAIRLLAFDLNDETDTILADIHNSSNSNELVKRDVIYAMAKRQAKYWLSDVMKRFAQLTPWEQRAVIAVSYGLGDEGHHWRRHRTRELSEIDRAYLAWLGRRNNGVVWEFPI